MRRRTSTGSAGSSRSCTSTVRSWALPDHVPLQPRLSGGSSRPLASAVMLRGGVFASCSCRWAWASSSGARSCRGGSSSCTSSSPRRSGSGRCAREPVLAPERRLRRSLRSSASSRPELRDPVLIASFRGWNDGGQGASLAGGYLAKTWEAERFAEIDPEKFFDFGHAAAGLARRGARGGSTGREHLPPLADPRADRDAVLLLGSEPNLRWRTFTELVTGSPGARRRVVVTLGSLLADVPHTRPAPVTAARATRTWSSASASSLPLRGADRNRRRAPRRVQPRATCRRSVSGPPCRTTSRWRRARAPRKRSASGSATSSARRSTRASSRRRPSATSSRSARPWRPTRTRPPTSRSSRARREARRRGGPAVGRGARGRADALPARARARNGGPEREATRARPTALAERERVRRRPGVKLSSSEALAVCFCATSV